jgi:hypothetical protein
LTEFNLRHIDVDTIDPVDASRINGDQYNATSTTAKLADPKIFMRGTKQDCASTEGPNYLEPLAITPLPARRTSIGQHQSEVEGEKKFHFTRLVSGED